MHQKRVESLSHTQQERLAYVEFRLYFMGEIGRPDLAGRFGVGKAFSPIFEHAPQRILSALSLGFGGVVNGETKPLLPCESPTALSNQQMEVLAPIYRAIHAKRPVAIHYHSISSGEAD